jgi:hypothetical protein
LYKAYSNPNYEHLWFKFNHVRFGGGYWPEFQFRLAAADVKQGGFSVHPRFEFPVTNASPLPFKKWQTETSDLLGERMEFRFALAPPAIDVQAWDTLVTEDQALVASILWQLPYILELVENQGARVGRPFADWQKLVSDMQDVYRLLRE